MCCVGRASSSLGVPGRVEAVDVDTVSVGIGESGREPDEARYCSGINSTLLPACECQYRPAAFAALSDDESEPYGLFDSGRLEVLVGIVLGALVGRLNLRKEGRRGIRDLTVEGRRVYREETCVRSLEVYEVSFTYSTRASGDRAIMCETRTFSRKCNQHSTIKTRLEARLLRRSIWSLLPLFELELSFILQIRYKIVEDGNIFSVKKLRWWEFAR